jgi:site-specific DNA-methyltransferase (cytosine-N4-specific)
VRVDQFSDIAVAETKILHEDARDSSVDDKSVQLVVTSPPYANSHDYYLYNKLRMFWLGYEVRSVQDAEIGSRNRHSDRGESVDVYLDSMERVLAEMHRVLVPGGRAVMVVADAVIRKQLFRMDELLSNRARIVGFACERKFGFEHRRFNAAFQRGFGTRQQKVTHVLVLRRS